jgi:integrase
VAAKMRKTRYPGIYKRGSRYVIVWRHRGKQHKESFRTLADAREAQGKRRQVGERRAHTKASFDEYAETWLSGYSGRTSRGLSETTRRDYRRSVETYAVPFFVGYRLAEIEPPDVRRFVQSLERRGIRASSIRKNIAPLKALFATAYEDGLIPGNPTQGVRITGGAEEDHDRKPKALTREELRVVLVALPEPWRPFFTFLAQTGLRISEAVAVTWADVDLGVRPHVKVRRQIYKGELKRLKSCHSERDLPLTAGMAQTLRERRARIYESDHIPVFPTRAGTPLSPRNLRRRVLDPVTASVGLPWIGFHTFRHTCASLLFAGGKDVKQVQEWLGHADPGFTLRTYVHLMDEGLGSADFLDVATGSQVASAAGV